VISLGLTPLKPFSIEVFIRLLCTDLGRETPESSVSEYFRRRCAKFYAWVRTAIRRIKKFGLRLCICSTTLAFVSQTRSDRKTHQSDSADGTSFIIEQPRTPPQARFGTITGEGKDWQRKKLREPLGVFLAAGLNV
jgi:hypothetical protein